MKKTCTVNISGRVFNIDEDAYDHLNDYLKAIEKKMRDQQDAEEVIADVEMRISELLEERMVLAQSVITIEDIRYVVSVMGSPGAFAGDESQDWQPSRSVRKLYRNPDDSVLSGVCGGLAVYFNIESWIVRVVFVALAIAFFSGGIVYLLLWLVLPEARTKAQKLEMRGKPVTFDNLAKAAKEEFDNVKKRMNL
jgi:phage shock protein PspC (stress-responsive transcriptional regulator)